MISFETRLNKLPATVETRVQYAGVERGVVSHENVILGEVILTRDTYPTW